MINDPVFGWCAHTHTTAHGDVRYGEPLNPLRRSQRYRDHGRRATCPRNLRRVPLDCQSDHCWKHRVPSHSTAILCDHGKGQQPAVAGLLSSS